jgi:sirohydrochlorin ferrochelatase
MSTALLLMAHGSPRESANEPIRRAAEVLRGRGSFVHVALGYMECNLPTIPQAAEECLQRGAVRIVAVPWFLHSGVHVTDDLPTILKEFAGKHPHVEVLMSDLLGSDPAVSALLLRRAEETAA